MAPSLPFFLLLLLLSPAVLADNFQLNLSKEKKTSLRFFMHYVPFGSSANTVSIVPALKGTVNSFGAIFVTDMPVTAGPSPNSTLIGRAQGFYIPSSLSEYAVLLNLNVAFVAGRYKGSSITVAGRDLPQRPPAERELPVVGGTGKFRLAQGFAFLDTCTFGDAEEVLGVDAFVLGY